MGAVPNYTTCLENWWGWPNDRIDALYLLGGASNIVVGSNPPFTIQDFFSFHPKFGGQASLVYAATTENSNTVSITPMNPEPTSGIPVSCPGVIPNGTFISSVSGNTLTLSSEAISTQAQILFTIWNASILPIAVINAYMFLASASLVQARWREQWGVGMGLFISHFLSLYAKADGNINSDVNQIAAQGLSNGILISKSAGDVSAGYTPVQGLDNWGAWNLTVYGQMLATLAKVIGSGPVLLW